MTSVSTAVCPAGRLGVPRRAGQEPPLRSREPRGKQPKPAGPSTAPLARYGRPCNARSHDPDGGKRAPQVARTRVRDASSARARPTRRYQTPSECLNRFLPHASHSRRRVHRRSCGAAFYSRQLCGVAQTSVRFENASMGRCCRQARSEGAHREPLLTADMGDAALSISCAEHRVSISSCCRYTCASEIWECRLRN